MAKSKKKSNKKEFWERLRFKYKLFILNEKTLEEVFHIQLSRFSAFLYFSAALIIVFALMSLLILYTPVKHFLPGFSDISVRSRLTTEVLRIDSLQNQVHFQELQMETMKNIIDGNIKIDSISKEKNISPEKWKELADVKSKREQKFTEQYENSDYYSPVTKIDEKKTIKIELFSAPVANGIIAKNSTKNGIEIACKSGENVFSAANGTVILALLSLENGYVVSVQHENGYISIYKNLVQTFKNAGDKVIAGETIGIVGNFNKNAVSTKLIFELWQNGKSVNSLEKIIF
ncbi:MAG: M23 family metallopeptidase [Prevotellaceae bacterium]|jgi:murein DD-endopeptidase MepM/ murein hydrolase activator NlpD|nr:M23 family metallopeptidase [Prevotellaceae bacterium]